VRVFVGDQREEIIKCSTLYWRVWYRCVLGELVDSCCVVLTGTSEGLV